MAWGDSWGSKPWSYHECFVKAFMEGREFGGERDDVTRVIRVERRAEGYVYMEYQYKGRAIARFTPPALMPIIIATKLTEGWDPKPGIDFYPELEFRCWFEDKGEARHLRALGIEAQWQGGGKPFLVFGADADDSWRTIEEAKALPKWVEPPPKRGPLPGRARFVNLTLPLPLEFA